MNNHADILDFREDRSLSIGALGAPVLPVAAGGVRVPDADGVALGPKGDTEFTPGGWQTRPRHKT